ncbi:MAG: hypothetical protein IIC13_12145 [SAR324 cluster bacterium]|nr:hypothetical protein [SAR324 cluster bacterium]MCH8887331.1 hypothetical protein [SAR324 cluster bacterium]
MIIAAHDGVTNLFLELNVQGNGGLFVDQKMRKLSRLTPLGFCRRVRLAEYISLNGYNFIVHGMGAFGIWRYGQCVFSGKKLNRFRVAMNDLAASTEVSSLGLLFRRKRREMNPRQKKFTPARSAP